jgi:hypothetical protein
MKPINFARRFAFFAAPLAVLSLLGGCGGAEETATGQTSATPPNRSGQSATRSPGADAPAEPIPAHIPDASPRENEALQVARRFQGTVAHATIAAEDLEKVRQTFDESDNAEVKAALAKTLGNAMDPDAFPTLLDAMEHESSDVRAAAGFAVEQMIRLGHLFKADDRIDKREQIVAFYRLFWRENKDGLFYEILKTPGAKEEHKRNAIETFNSFSAGERFNISELPERLKQRSGWQSCVARSPLDRHATEGLARRGFATRAIALRELFENKLASLGIDVSRAALNLCQCTAA